jgi:DNA-binding SARP family transcriptional activator
VARNAVPRMGLREKREGARRPAPSPEHGEATVNGAPDTRGAAAPAPDSGTTRVQLFGAARAIDRQGAEITSLGRRTWELLALLLTRPGRPLTRSELIDALWPNRPERRARASLATEAWRLRGALQPEGAAELVSSADDAVLLRAGSGMEVDVCMLEAAVAEATRMREQGGVTPALLARLSAALTDCRGPYLRGHDSEWLLIERERLHAVRLRGLELVVEAHERRGAYADAINWAQRLLTEDTLHERSHSTLIRLLALDGRRCEAAARYRRLEAMLAEELGVEPMPETQALIARILSGETLPAD